MKKLDPVVIIVDVLLLVGCGCMFLYGKMSAHSLFIVGIILVGVLVLYLYVTNYKDCMSQTIKTIIMEEDSTKTSRR